MRRLAGVVQEYAWGSPSVLPALLGTAPTGRPQAELWLGAHPLAPAKLDENTTLLSHLEVAPQLALGQWVIDRFGPRLPFLLKVLAVEEPLSLQVHPSEVQAREGFAREEAARVPRTDPRRNYKDPFHKPELVVALTRFDALCGFRRPEQMAERVARLEVPQLRSTVQMLEGWPDAVGVQGVVHGLWGMNETERRVVMGEVTRALERMRQPDAEFRLALQLCRRYPNDVGGLLSLLLNHITLEPGQGLFLPAGNVHAYLKGVAVEVMAASDNVLRGGLTPKHVDVPELLATVQYELGTVPVLNPKRARGEEVWTTPVADFRLSRLLSGGRTKLLRKGPEILLCVSGEAEVGGQVLKSGQALWVDADEPSYTFSGDGSVFRVTVDASEGARTRR